MCKNTSRTIRLFSLIPFKVSAATKGADGFSLLELLAAMTMTLLILGVAVTSFIGALSTREIESSRTDALTSAQAAINIMTREISNSGYGLKTNGVVTEDSGLERLRVRANTSNNDKVTSSAGEDIVFYYDSDSQSVVRYDANTGLTSGVINRVSEVEFQYFDYSSSTVTGPFDNPSATTGRVEVTLRVKIVTYVQGQPQEQLVTFRSDVTLRNAPYMLSQY